MNDSLERLYLAVLAAKDLDPATSRTARLFQRGPSQMAKKLAEEAIEVVIDAVNASGTKQTSSNFRNPKAMDKSGPRWFIAPCSNGSMTGVSRRPQTICTL